MASSERKYEKVMCKNSAWLCKERFIAMTSTDLEKPVILLSVIRTFNDLFLGEENFFFTPEKV